MFVAGSFSGARILNGGVGYVAGEICIQGDTHGGSGFNGTYGVDALNGSLSSISIIQHGVNYTKDPSLFGLCYPSSNVLQVCYQSHCLVSNFSGCSSLVDILYQEKTITRIEVLQDGL